MLDKAHESDWEQVASLDAERRILVDDCFSQATAHQDAHLTAAAIREILQINQSILEIGQRAKNELGEQITTHATGKAALNAYQNCTSDL